MNPIVDISIIYIYISGLLANKIINTIYIHNIVVLILSTISYWLIPAILKLIIHHKIYTLNNSTIFIIFILNIIFTQICIWVYVPALMLILNIMRGIFNIILNFLFLQLIIKKTNKLYDLQAIIEIIITLAIMIVLLKFVKSIIFLKILLSFIQISWIFTFLYYNYQKHQEAENNFVLQQKNQITIKSIINITLIQLFRTIGVYGYFNFIFLLCKIIAILGMTIVYLYYYTNNNFKAYWLYKLSNTCKLLSKIRKHQMLKYSLLLHTKSIMLLVHNKEYIQNIHNNILQKKNIKTITVNIDNKALQKI